MLQKTPHWKAERDRDHAIACGSSWLFTPPVLAPVVEQAYLPEA